MSDTIQVDHPGTYTQAVKAILLNRILLVLAFIGLFVSGALSIEKFMNVSLPCGNSTGCDLVAGHPSSMLFGLIPVAYIGLLGYILMAGLGIARGLKTPYDLRLATGGFAASILGAAFSVYLQYVSLAQIHALCPYCFTSAVDMILTCAVYALLVKDLKGHPLPEAEPSRFDVSLMTALPIAVVLGLAVMPGKPKGRALDIGKVEMNLKSLVPDNPNSFGPTDAPITIVEFADLCCPSCQQVSPKVKEFATQHSTTVRIVFREFPLTMHEYGRLSAAMAEYAAEKGRFWDFTMSVMGLNRQPESVDELLKIAKSVGLDPDDMRKRLSDKNDPVFDRVTRDLNLGHAVGVNQTPTFIILAKGLPPASGGSDVLKTLEGAQYKKILTGES